jgi:hypothetical protein
LKCKNRSFKKTFFLPIEKKVFFILRVRNKMKRLFQLGVFLTIHNNSFSKKVL